MRIVVVGSGVAGLTAALGAARDHDVTIVTKAAIAESNTRYAQGGIAAAVFPDDSVAAHAADTVAAGAGLCDVDAVAVLCGEAPERIRELVRLGVPFDRVGGQLARGLEAAHSNARVLHAGGDATGAAIEAALVAAVRAAGIRVLEHGFVADVETGGRGVTGVALADGSRIDADAVILASGGAGQLYSHTTNPAVATGDGIAAALRAGAEVRDLEFYQFHPTTLDAPGNFLVSEAVRGEGAVLLGNDGRRFMPSVHPLAELAPRDVVARAIAERMALQGGAPVLLDATALGRRSLAERFPSITRACLELGIDWAQSPVPVTPAAHYAMGGVTTDLWGRTSVPGLFAVGEVARTGVHGANRLASNSLLEALVFGVRAAQAVGMPWVRASSVPDAAHRRPVSPETGTESFTRAQLQDLMWRRAGLVRDREGLSAAASVLSRWRPTTDTVDDRETANLLAVARRLVSSALAREESVGAHYRSDSASSITTDLEQVALAC